MIVKQALSMGISVGVAKTFVHVDSRKTTILGGALAPTIAVMLWNTYGVVYVSVYMALAAVATIICVSLLTETSGNQLD